MKTAQPSASAAPPGHRWVILRHDFPWLHWDLLLAPKGAPAARTWRLLRSPCCNEPIAAQALPDHRLVYLDYEGPVSGGRGTVQRLERGEWLEPATETAPPDAGAAVDSPRPAIQPLLHIRLLGSPRFSSATLTCGPDGRLFWTLTAVLPDVEGESQSPLVPPQKSC